ncbi:MFS transporter [Cricetibacter osteomyelitidis]|uniref:MFS transporter n=1 Tax=Cricetibacter osteomyelitidis TaxID=1521931 RepID=A0A4R2T5G1_9PAST|nr:MFS transporter [Cricetibacter osteomyelitidis]TCP97305.1 MFS transporter [Cricetibacter osteomyelitidis]
MLNKSDKHLMYLLILGIVLPLLDTTLVNVALTVINREFNSDLTYSQWIISSYGLAAVCTVPLAAFLTESIGTKRVWLIGLMLFCSGILLAGLSAALGWLITARIMQGAATGLMLPTMQIIVVQSVGAEKTRSALAMMSVPTVIAPIIAPLIAGLILDYYSWQWLFWLQMPLCILAWILSWIHLPDYHPTNQSKADISGLLMIISALCLTVYNLNHFQTFYNGLGIGGGLLIGLLFYYHQKKKAEAAINLNLFHILHFRYQISLLFQSSLLYYGGIVFYPILFIQSGLPAITVGGLLALQGIGTLISRQMLAKLSTRYTDHQILIFCSGLTLISSLILALPLAINTISITALLMLLRGYGLGILTILPMSNLYQGLEKKQIAHASVISRMVIYLAASLAAVIVSIGLTLSSSTIHFIFALVILWGLFGEKNRNNSNNEFK